MGFHGLAWVAAKMPVRRTRIPVALAGIALWLLPQGAAHATEGGASLYVPGLKGPMAGYVPPPGFYFEDDFYSYSGRLSASARTQIGGAVLAGVKVEARVNFMTPTWITPIKILGGDLGFAITLPFGTPAISAGALISAPKFGGPFAFSKRDATFNIGDPVVSSFVGWHAGNFHWQTGISTSIPSGAYQPGQLSNLSFNRWIGDIYASGTWLNPATGLDISGSMGFEINGTNQATDYRSGNAFHADLAISQNFSKEFSAGLLIGHYQQITGDSGSGAAVGSHKGRVTAVGGQIAYNFNVGKLPITTRIKVLREVIVDNRPQGTIALFTVAVPLAVTGAH